MNGTARSCATKKKLKKTLILDPLQFGSYDHNVVTLSLVLCFMLYMYQTWIHKEHFLHVAHGVMLMCIIRSTFCRCS